jgi:hypothetical protein
MIFFFSPFPLSGGIDVLLALFQQHKFFRVHEAFRFKLKEIYPAGEFFRIELPRVRAGLFRRFEQFS